MKISWIDDSWATDFDRRSVEALDPAQLFLERDGDELLDLVRRVAERDRLDLHLRRRELGEDVDLGLRHFGEPAAP